MAETSGFFQAMMDETTGKYDRVYLAREFANYFALFVKNGVFGSPTNQLRVSPGNGLSISVAPGNAFIKGMWYNNSSMKNIVIVPNYTSSNRVDTVRIRMSDLTRAITAEVFTGDADLVRGEDVFDLQIATVTVKPGDESITAADIADTRPNENVCGFVTQLLRVETTADLFAQYQAQFDQWFAAIQESLSGDVAGNLQNQIDAIETDVGELQADVLKLKKIKVNNRQYTVCSFSKYENANGFAKQSIDMYNELSDSVKQLGRSLNSIFAFYSLHYKTIDQGYGYKTMLIPGNFHGVISMEYVGKVPYGYAPNNEIIRDLTVIRRPVAINLMSTNEFEFDDCRTVDLSGNTGYETISFPSGKALNKINVPITLLGYTWDCFVSM